MKIEGDISKAWKRYCYGGTIRRWANRPCVITVVSIRTTLAPETRRQESEDVTSPISILMLDYLQANLSW
ncbi:hypothetical protein, partial [Methanomethylophilus alvi]|uniref:hypothetical protein n=1 Tax=Methanomethylophilus alvi TaxID=1291540 RepID=UPI0037DCA046